MEDVARYAEKILVMNQSKLFCYDTVEHVFQHAEALQQMGLEVPQVTRVCMALRQQGIPLDESIYTVEEAARQFLQAYAAKRGIPYAKRHHTGTVFSWQQLCAPYGSTF